MSDEYISRQAAQAVLCDACGNAACPKGLIPRCSYYDRMQDIPPADVRPVVRGKWIRKHDDVCYWSECSNCGEYPPKDRWNREWESAFCPNCGADMR